ncbi:WecB/TagA/CpsF family glycosyltransferase [Ruegeria halocynthiae]|nr:WecB/TagA/CpsF family glycosyltransferase [Ruegeria halocynthiae]
MTESRTYAETEFLDLVSYTTHGELLDSVSDYWQNCRGFALATLNLDHIVKMRHMPEFFEAYKAHTHVVADGNPIVWLSRIAGRPIELMPGSDLILPLSKLAAEQNVPIALLGATKETLNLAADHLEQAYPGLRVVARIAPPFGFDPAGDDAASQLRTIRASGAKLCFLALGAPKQELLAARGLELAPECGFVSIGAGLDFISGRQSRAPRWVRMLALEWLWRALGNPSRLAARYGRCILILPGLFWQALKLRYLRN